MMGIKSNTLLQIPQDVTNPTELRRFFDIIITRMDYLYGLRGGTELASNDLVVGQVSSLKDLVDEINRLTALYMPLEGGKEFTSEVMYSTELNITNDRTLVHKAYVDSKSVPTLAPAKLNQIISTAPTKGEVTAIQERLNDVISALKTSLTLN